MDGKAGDIKLLIIEDEAYNSRMLQEMVVKLRPGWKVLAILEGVAESVNWLKINIAPDLILLDIQLSDGICFSIFNQVTLNPSTKIIFTTAYDEYAIRAFKVNSIDYLLKPIEESDLETALRKYEQQHQMENDDFQKNPEYYAKLIDSILRGKKEYRKRFLIAGYNSFQKLETKDVAYFYSDNKITFAVDFQNKEHLLEYNLEQLESELHPEQFFRANRKIIVNVDSVKKVINENGGKLLVQMDPAPYFEIVVSRLKATDFKIWLGK
jgi:DNA-binding LytR/AlgR family response regulator